MLHAIILAGGVGARLWPMSREFYPKQFHKFNGEYTLLQETMLRVNGAVPYSNIIIVTNDTHAMQIRTQSAQISGEESITILQEPAGKNTAPAIALGLFYLQRENRGNEIVVVLPSDHVIRNREAFNRLLRLGEKAAEDNYLVTFGIKPDRPETGYGYIKKRDEMIGEGIYKVDKFVEKPDKVTAQQYLEAGDYFWNSGIFMFKVSTILEEYRRLLPGIYEEMQAIDFENNLEKIYASLESVSIDYGIMEKSDRVAVIPADMGWVDIGSWQFLYKSLPKDENGNVFQGNVLALDSSNNIIFSEKKLVAGIGLDNMVVINTDDALLICPQERSQDVKKIFDHLKKVKAEEYQIHTTVEKPWGSYTVLEKGPRFKIKRVLVNPGQRLSMQMHYHRSEHWIVVAGTAKITNGDKEFFLHTNESTYIPMSTKHRLENPGKVSLELIEVQNGEYIEEDDIVRFSDDYGR